MDTMDIIRKLLHNALDHLRPIAGDDPINIPITPAGKAFFEISCALFRLSMVKIDEDDLKYLSSDGKIWA